MPYIGCHLSSTKGNFEMVKTAKKIGADTFAFFTRNPRGSKAKPIDPADCEKAMAALKEQHPEYAPMLLTMENVSDSDWENNWQQFYKPMEIGERLLVLPCWLVL